MIIDLKIIITQPKGDDESSDLHQLTVEADGKDSQIATWETLSAFTGNPKTTSDKLCELIQDYEKKAYDEPGKERRGEMKPDRCWIRDDKPTKNKPKPFRPFEQLDWKPARIQVKPKTIEILVNESEETVIWDDKNGSKNKKITSKLTRYEKQPVGSLFTPTYSCEYEVGICPSETSCFVSDGNKPVDWVLENANVLPGCNKVQATKHKILARIYYNASLSGTVLADYGYGSSKGKQYWNYPIDGVLKFNGMDPNIVIHEDVELQYFTNIHDASKE